MRISTIRTAVSMQSAFYGVLALTLAFRFWFAHALPMTGDEAYFIYWGAYPDYGYYDHPPMVGWILALLLQISHAPWVLRLPSILLPALIAFVLLGYLRKADEVKAYLAALAFLLLPANVWNVLITTDTPLVLFSFFSALCFAAALRRDAVALYAASGAFLGLAFLSKYFAVLLGIAYLVFAARQGGRRVWQGMSVLIVCALPSAALNAWWNYGHCWANLQFNIYNRHGDAGWSLKTPPLYLLSVIYILCPVALFQFWRNREVARQRCADPVERFFLVTWAVPLSLFALMSLVKQIGLHWLLSFVPLFFISAALTLSAVQLRRSVVYLSVLSAIHLAAIGVISALPMETWKSSRVYDGIVLHVKTGEMLQQLAHYRADYVFAADGYSPAVTAGFASGRYFFVFGTASSHARHDDILTDFRALAGKNILVLRKSPPNPEDYAPYFARVTYRHFELHEAHFYLVLGEGFDYVRYREKVLRPLRDRYYRIPSYLPQGHCYFCDRYFPDEPYPAR